MPDKEVTPFLLEKMAVSLHHRGPDASGTWVDADAGIGFAHRRLSILDLSTHGAQPMVSASGRFVLCYNGEIYNHGALRGELEHRRTVPWRGHSDTEVLLEAIEQWGVETALERSNGMFAFAVWDRQHRTLTLARDRMGEKPLYVGQVGGALIFASELKAFRLVPGWKHTVDQQALSMLLRFGYVSAPLSIHEGIFKLPAASFVTFSSVDATVPMRLADFVSRTKHYWDLAGVAEAGISRPFDGDEAEAVDELEASLAEAVRMRMEADVPVGVMLSGGIDSSLVAALMQRASVRPVRTFTIGFREDRFDEARHAKQVAAHLGTDHTEFHLTPKSALGVIPQLAEIYDEPFADPSQIPSILVSSIARQHVTVALSGDGGDELFFGYGRYAAALRTWRNIGRWPASVRGMLAASLGASGRMIGKIPMGQQQFGFRLARLGHRINAADFDSYSANLMSLALQPTASGDWPTGLPSAPILSAIPDGLTAPSDQMMFVDQSLYLPENILTKVDRASMAASLEMRAPLLDPSVIAFAWSLPEKFRFDGRVGKVLLRKLLYRYVPQQMVDRPKQGFEIPLDEWLRGPLCDWMLDLLAPAAIQMEGYLDARMLSKLVTEHLTGRANHGYTLWPALMFQAWQQRYR